MNHEPIDWETIHASPSFRSLMRSRRRTVLSLGAVAGAYYFSIPALLAWFPDFFKLQLAPGINLGVAFAVSQYPLGIVIALIFMWKMSVLGRRAAALRLRASDLARSYSTIDAASAVAVPADLQTSEPAHAH